MPSQIVTLPIDCLSKIFECLDEDKVTLHSCLLVNRLWCRISVEILWRNIWDFKCTIQPHRSDVLSKIFNTLKRLIYNLDIYYMKIPNFINFPGAKDCLKIFQN